MIQMNIIKTYDWQCKFPITRNVLEFTVRHKMIFLNIPMYDQRIFISLIRTKDTGVKIDYIPSTRSNS